jgi:hypothetical protein
MKKQLVGIVFLIAVSLRGAELTAEVLGKITHKRSASG